MAKKKPIKKGSPKGSGKMRKILWALLGLLLLSGACSVYWVWKTLYRNNLTLIKGEPNFLYIPTGTQFESVLNIMRQRKLLISEAGFVWTARQKRYDHRVKAGRYRLRPGMSNAELVNLLRSGRQEPVRLTLVNLHSPRALAQKVGKFLEADSTALLNLMQNDHALAEIGFNSDNVLSVVLPNTYEFYWNTDARQFFNRMFEEYRSFWNETRTREARKLGLSKVEVSILASIVERETQYKPERPTIARVYMNRLKKGMRLQADPTVVFAVGDFSINRVRSKHLEVESPYNTYKITGLPPGPICLPSVNAIEAVLKAPSAPYLFFCAKEDFSGTHRFAVTESEHLANARKFQKAMNARGIR
jgi:UPF0755 protein